MHLAVQNLLIQLGYPYQMPSANMNSKTKSSQLYVLIT